MMGQFQLRPMREQDIDDVATIEAASFSDAWPASAFRQMLLQPHVRMQVADGECVSAPGTTSVAVVGYCVLMLMADEGEIANIAVTPAMRGRGLAGRLLDEALDAAVSAGALAVFLEVRESNAAARRLYESRGFQQVGRRRGYYNDPREDALLLRRVRVVA